MNAKDANADTNIDIEQAGFDVPDMWGVIALRLMKWIPERTFLKATERTQPSVIHRFGSPAKEDYDAWIRGDARQEFKILREIMQYYQQFKVVLHHYYGCEHQK